MVCALSLIWIGCYFYESGDETENKNAHDGRGGGNMATKSILKNINIRTKHAAVRLADAMEYSKNFGNRPVEFQRSVSDATRDDILKMFGKK